MRLSGRGVLTCVAVLFGIGALAAGDARGGAETARRADLSWAERFEALRKSFGDLTYAQLAARLKLRDERPAQLTFDPTRVTYYPLVRKALALTREEEAIYRKTGMVVVDHEQRYTMASSYLAIYRQDLPVLITADSILHAMHRSFDAILVEIETAQLAPALAKILDAAHERLRAETAKLPGGRPGDTARDVDLFLSVARNLLADPETKEDLQRAVAARGPHPNCDNPANFSTSECQAAKVARLSRGLAVKSLFGQDAAVGGIVRNVAALEQGWLLVYGGKRKVDWSQFKPRGHYANSPALRRYFETMMWLGRADLGFHLSEPAPGSGPTIDVARERADAVVLTDLLRGAGQLEPLGAIDRLLAYLVGPSDNVTPTQLAAALASAGPGGLARLSDRAVAARVVEQVQGGRQQINSQFLKATKERGSNSAVLPSLFQFFGQRFVPDSFVLSRVVAGEITFRGEQQDRQMPSGLDVMAALGDDEAVRLLRPELQKYEYSANLLAARTLLREQPAASWDATAYGVWLDAVSRLSRGPGVGVVPEVMRSPAWRRKELQTQLASWAELRHDTILYAKQSYSFGVICEYPAGYVEPYPELFSRVAFFADELARRLGRAWTDRMKAFLGTFSSRVRQLEGLARKELAGKPFSAEEQQFVKDAIHLKVANQGCGGPREVYTGWYPTLFYNGDPASWEPTVADVHTDSGGRALEVGVGDVDFLVVAVDNGGDRAAYVGPVYSYYEFPSGDRVTDEAWRETIKAGKLPPRPDWVGAFQSGVKPRVFEPPPEKPHAGPPRPLAATPVDEGALTGNQLRAGMDAIQGKLELCYAKFKVDGPLTVNVRITPSGRVESATIGIGPTGTPAGACILKAIGTAQFAQSENGLSWSYSLIGM